MVSAYLNIVISKNSTKNTKEGQCPDKIEFKVQLIRFIQIIQMKMTEAVNEVLSVRTFYDLKENNSLPF